MSLDIARPHIGPAEDPRHQIVSNPSTIWVDRVYWLAVAGDRTLELTRTEFELLAFLLDHPYVVFDRPALVRQVWREETSDESRKVDVHIARLRRKIGPLANRQIETLRGVGYRYRPISTHATASEVSA